MGSIHISMCTFVTSASVAAAAAWLYYATSPAQADGLRFPASLPPQTVVVDPLQFAVLGQNATFRSSSFTEFFNPTNTTPPFFQAFDPAFLDILGSNPSIRVIASNPGFAFAHEAPIWVQKTNEVFFASNDGGPLGFSDIDHNNQVSKVSLNEVDVAIKNARDATSALNVTVTALALPGTVQMTNGGTGPFRGNLLLVNSGRGNLPPSITIVNPEAPHNATVLLDNFFGRQFNSLNDVKIHPTSKKLFFTDVTYGWLNHFRPLPLLPSQVYRFDPDTGIIRVVADGFDRPNGIAFTKDGKTAYIADTGASGGFLGNNQTEPATIYAFDVDSKTQAFHNRRVFAYVDTGVADGVQLDNKDNVYAGTGDGAHVWNPEGTLLGKFFIGNTSANLIFANKGQLVILGETEIVLAQIAAEGFNLAF
ncbi:D-lactonohydrolase-like protein [Irpex rosettiformis]|uniref:D-lactonohydrolase-like protein n=1 Tax=Irpex rosettiformis TaxID=378272 RepID=A0ACB8TRD5_9APHY|nr:D-lactonohydrolase-like protein [Irpex rosettiformis]